MKPSVIGHNNLFRLIQSLTMSEKRYFKLSLSIQGQDKNYQTLFDIINKQQAYDEEEIKKKLKGAALLNNFHVAKKYLFDAIMKSLINYHANRSADFQIQNLIQQVRILNKKGLTDMSKILIDKCEKLAKDYERYHILPEINHLRAINLTDQSFRGYTEQDLESYLAEEEEVLNKLQNIHHYRSHFLRITSNSIKSERVWDEESLQWFKQILKDPYIQDESKADTLQAKLILYNILFVYYGEVGNPQKSFEYKIKYIEELDKNPKVLNERVDLYISSINNLLVGLLDLFKVDDVPTYLEKIRSVEVKNEKMESLRFRAYYLNLTEYYNKLGKHDQLIALAPELDEGMTKYHATLDIRPKEILTYQLAYAYFIMGDYGKCIDRLLKIINRDDDDLNNDILAYSKILLIMSHYELGNYDIVEYLLRSTKRYFEKMSRAYPFEANLMEFFSKVLKVHQKNDSARQLFEGLKKKMEEALKDPIQQKILDYFDITSWIDAQLSGKLFHHVVVEKVNQKLKAQNA